MLPSYVLSLREGLEAALIIGILIGAVRKFNRSELNVVVWAGLSSATVISLLVAIILQSLGASLV